MVDLRHQLAVALAGRDSQHAAAERADEACEGIAARCELLAAELDDAVAERDSLGLQLAMSEDAREAAEAQAAQLRLAFEVGFRLEEGQVTADKHLEQRVRVTKCAAKGDTHTT